MWRNEFIDGVLRINSGSIRLGVATSLLYNRAILSGFGDKTLIDIIFS